MEGENPRHAKMMEAIASEWMPLPLGADLRPLIAGHFAPWARAPNL